MDEKKDFAKAVLARLGDASGEIGKSSEVEKPEASSPSVSGSDVASEELMDAFKAGDAKAFKRALKSLMQMIDD